MLLFESLKLMAEVPDNNIAEIRKKFEEEKEEAVNKAKEDMKVWRVLVPGLHNKWQWCPFTSYIGDQVNCRSPKT